MRYIFTPVYSDLDIVDITVMRWLKSEYLTLILVLEGMVGGGRGGGG